MSDRVTAAHWLRSFALSSFHGSLGSGRVWGAVQGRRRRRWNIEPLECRALLSTITVMNTNDAGPGTLRAAITQADLDATPDTILFAPAVTGTISLLSVLPDLSASIDIEGPGSSDLTLARNPTATTNFRIFDVLSAAVVELSGLTITGGVDTGTGSAGFGGGIENSGSLSLIGVTLSGNTAGVNNEVEGTGGGIDNSGTLSISDSTISGNVAAVVPVLPGEANGGYGGAIYNTGTLSLSDTSFTGNSGEGGGGAILNSGELTVTDSTFTGNKGGGYESPAGAIGNSGSATVSGSTFADNTSDNGGGGISNSGTFSLADSTVAGNEAFNSQGAGVNNSGSMTISNSMFAGNSNQGAGGAIANSGGLAISGSVFTGNVATSSLVAVIEVPNPGDGGGILNGGTLSVTNSTFNGNSTNGGSGGAIYSGGTVSLTYVTMDDNSVSGDGSTGGGVAIATSSGAAVTSVDSIFDNPQGGSISGGSATNFQSLGHNLFSDIPSVTLASSDLVNTDPRLAPLANNGGPTMTQGLYSDSPAIGAGVPLSGVATDQRGLPRGPGSTTDVGAFELQPNEVIPEPSVPTEISLERFGVHDQPTSLALTFSQPVNAAAAANRANYRLVILRRGRRPGSIFERVIPIRSARYIAASDKVRLRPIVRLPLRRTYKLTIVTTPPIGLTDSNGVYLYGPGSAQPGGDIVLTFNQKSLAR